MNHRLPYRNKSFVSVEPEVRESSLTPSPAKTYTPLHSSSPKTLSAPVVQESPAIAPLQIDEGIAVVTEPELPLTTIAPTTLQDPQKTLEAEENTADQDNPSLNETPTGMMENNEADLGRELLEEFISPRSSQVVSPLLNQFLATAAHESLSQFTRADFDLARASGQLNTQPPEQMEIPTTETSQPACTRTSISVTRQEIRTISSLLERIPQRYVTRERSDCDQPLTLMVVDATNPAPVTATSSQEETGTSALTGVPASELREEDVVRSGKRHRPKYSLTSAMFKKHPVMKFSATGPLDKDKTPHKWWCRVCKVELSLMSRGSLELVSHYRTESHLLKEHRMRMEIAGLALYDKNEKELLGVALQDAKKKAKDMYPIAPQLDVCRPLVGQDVVPDFSAVKSPTEKVLSQITVLEHGLRYGGHINSLTSIYDELARIASSSHMTTQNWSPQRLFVSDFLLFLLLLVNLRV